MAVLVIGFAAPGCGGETGQIAAPNDGGPPETSSAPESGASDAATTEASPDATPPPPDSSACARADDVCVLCSDGYWHCGRQVILPPCPPDLDASANCTGTAINGNNCFTCASNGTGVEWECLPVMPEDGIWKLVSYPCAP